MTPQEFATKLENLYHTSKSQEPKTIKVGILLPWELQNNVKDIQAALPHMHIMLKESMSGNIVEAWVK